MLTYHGTSQHNAQVLSQHQISVNLGGGELGRGFYSGEHLYEAKQWAAHVSKDLSRNVVCIDTPDSEIDLLHTLPLDQSETCRKRRQIRLLKETRTYTFGCDLVIAPIVGTDKTTGEQFKWESCKSEQLLNDRSKTSLSVK